MGSYTALFAVAINHKTDEKLSTTREGSRGVFFSKRTADTYKPSTGEKTHKTEMVTKGILFPKKWRKPPEQINPMEIKQSPVGSQRVSFSEEKWRKRIKQTPEKSVRQADNCAHGL